MNDMRFEQVTKHYGNRTIMSELSLELNEGQITCIMGSSGIGKTTLLRMAAGLELPDSGIIERRSDMRIGYVFQEPRLLPRKTVLDNVRWVLDDQKHVTNNEIAIWLTEAGMAHALTSYPDHLSGGMKQRVSLIRAFVTNPGLLLMDEPFQSLDAGTRQDMQKLLLRLWHKNKPTILLVTHDLDEALALGTRIVVLTGAGSLAMDIFHAAADVGADTMRFTADDIVKLHKLVNGHQST
jgi:ABC-type nitrate/sulfonate/bicarbonate transport system ATPase subunit